MKFKSINELLKYTDNIKGKTFYEIDSENLLKNNKNLKKRKGVLGQVVETGFYKYPINNDPHADFDEIGVELKVSGYKISKTGKISAKERISLSKIDYNSIVNEEFNYSKLISKNSKILIIWYLYEKDKDIGDFKITDYQLYEMKNDKEVFKNDFNIIKNKVLEGKAHELSEGDTSYLGACTKAAKSTDRTTQPFSDIPAKPRAYSLKNSYLTGILRNFKSSQKSKVNNKILNIEDYINPLLKPYLGKTQLNIYEKLTGTRYDNKVPKNISKLITDIIIGKDKELPEKDDIFTKTSFIIKNIPIQYNEKPKERMAFRTIRLSEFDENWEDSNWKSYFEETTLITILWQETDNKCKNGHRVLKGIKKISFDDNDLSSFEKTFNKIKETIEKKDINLLPTPNSFEGQCLEVAPKGQKGDDAYNNFFKEDKTKVALMLNKNFLYGKIKD